MQWLRPEFEGREGELETRADFEKRTGITAMSLSSHFTRYADKKPPVVAKHGKLKFFAAAELDSFVRWISENSGTRSEADVKRSEIARLKDSIDDAEDRRQVHLAALDKADRDKARFQRKLRQEEEALDFLEKGR